MFIILPDLATIFLEEQRGLFNFLTSYSVIASLVFYLDRVHIYIQTGHFLLNYRAWFQNFARTSAPDPLFLPRYRPLLRTPIWTCNSSPAPHTTQRYVTASLVYSPKAEVRLYRMGLLCTKIRSGAKLVGTPEVRGGAVPPNDHNS